MAWRTYNLDSLPIPFPGNNPLAPERLRNCWEQERDAWDECKKIGDRVLASELSVDEARLDWAWARAAHRTARERFETAESAFLDELSDKHAACAAEAQKHFAAAIQLQLMRKCKGEGKKAGGELDDLLPSLDVFERFIALQHAMTTSVLGSIRDRIYKLRAEHHRIASGEEEVLHNINTLCQGMQAALGVPVSTGQQQLQELRENTDDWERSLEVNIQREDIGLREHMQVLQPGITLMSQYQKDWLQRIRQNINGWLDDLEKDLARRTARLRGKVDALAEHDGSDGWQNSIEEIKHETEQIQSVMESADAAVGRLMQ
ncbi:MAG: hypothetical protein IKZ87_04735 [Actinomycetaceae bacterium]|nr:hypothetical protein [Actinomycetaceae bacterium]